MHAPLTFEALTIVFFAAVAVAAACSRAGRPRRLRVALLAMLLAGSVVAITSTPPGVRLWLGHAYLVLGYWLPALLVSPNISTRLEDWLVGTDVWWRRYAMTTPNWTTHALELSYLLCYVLVPVAFTVIWIAGTVRDADRFWTTVLASGFACYGSLPWLITRPPRVRPQPDTPYEIPAQGVRRLNLFVLERVSHGLNTFPSGHVAVSLAAALEVFAMSRPLGFAMTAIAVAIAGGAVAGRYHYVMDVGLGILVGTLASLLT